MYAKSQTTQPSKTKTKQAQSSARNVSPASRNPGPAELIQLAAYDPTLLSHQNFRGLQQTIGNQAVGRLLKGQHETSEGGVIQKTADRPEEIEKNRPTPNRTGLPDNLKAGVENLSGYSLDDVRAHYNSSQPARLGALAYTQGTDIYVAPGQEQHLPHEAWHVAQQKQGRVKPTLQLMGSNVNDDAGLEQEADVMGNKALYTAIGSASTPDIFQKSLEGTTSPIQYVRKNKVELLGLTVSEFDKHRKAEQMDWANVPSLTELERNIIWEVLDWGTSGLASFTLLEIISKIQAKPKNLTHLKMYCMALNGKIGDEPTIQLETVTDIDEAIKQGDWIVKLDNKIGGSHLKSTIPVDVFKALIAKEPVADKFLDYYEHQKPILQTPTGKEVESFIDLVDTEGAKISDYTSDLPDIRNYHKFYKSSLDKLKTDKGKKDKPLTLILLSLFDHNGAFNRHEHVKKVIENTKTNAFAIEGADESKLTSLKDSGLAQIATAHGMEGKITQIMVAGHGNSKSIEVAGKETQSGVGSQTGKHITIPDYGTKYDLEFDDKKGTFWTDFFNAAFANMETKGGLKPKVLLRACLTGSNELDLKKLKATLKTEGLDLDGTGTDPTTDENQTKIKEAIKKQFTTHGSLVTVLEDKAKGKGIDILGAQASITAGQTESVKDTGELGIIPATGIAVEYQDTYVAGSKIDYVRHGKEPIGAIKAVIESWANNQEDTFKKMNERISNPVNTDEGFIIGLLYNTILANYQKNILEANKLVSTAGVLHGIANGGAECRASYLKNDEMIQKHQKDFYTSLLLKFNNKFAQLVIYEDWMEKDNAKRKEFVDQLAKPGFNKNNVDSFLDLKILGSHFKPILTGNIGDERGRILLALFGLIEGGKQVDCKNFLRTQADTDGKLLKKVTDELMGYSEDSLRNDLDLPVETAPKVSSSKTGPAKPQKNIDFSKEYYVVPMRPQIFIRDLWFGKKVRIRETPDPSSTELESFSDSRDITIVGEVKQINDDAPVGRYMVKRSDGTIGYVSNTSIKPKG